MLAVLFAIYMSEYMICLICMDRSAYALESAGEVLHYLKMPAVAAGFVLYPLLCRLGSDIRTRRIVILATNVAFMAGMASVMWIGVGSGLPLYVLSCAVSLLSLGILGGSVYYCFAMGLTGYANIGLLSGIAGAAAFLIQMTVLYAVNANIAMLILLLAGFAFTACLTLGSNERFDWMFDEPVEYARKGDPALPSAKVIVAGIVAMMLIYMICGFTDTILLNMNYTGDMGIYAWPRLFGALGYILGGILADIGRRRWLPVAALCMGVLCIPLPFVLSEGYVVAGTCLYYVIVISQLEFLNVFFWELAPRTDYPRLFAGMSRVLMCVSVVILPAFSSLPVIADIMIEVVMIVAVIPLLIFCGGIPSVNAQFASDHHNRQPASGQPSVSDTEDDGTSESAEEAHTREYDDKHLNDFVREHGLTPRERECLMILLESDDDVAAIATKMEVTTRTVYRHISSIYEKTGTDTRYALMRYYYRQIQVPDNTSATYSSAHPL